MDNYSALLKKEGENYQYLVKHILYAKTFDPKFSQEAELMINQYFENVMSPEDSEASNRLWEILRNSCYAIARLKLKNTINTEDAKEVIEFYDRQLKYWSQTAADIPRDIRDQAYEEINKKLTGQKFKSEFEQLLQAVCKENVDIDEYVKKFDKEGKRDWTTTTNIKIRQIRDKFTKGPRDVYMILDISPLTLACRKTYAGSDKEVVIGYYDESDKNDTSDIDGKRDEENPSNTNTGTKPEISNKGVIPSITPIIPITLHSKEELTNVDPTKSDKSDTSDNNKSVTDENSNGQNGQLGNQNLGGSNASDDGNVNGGTKPDMPKVIDNEQQEDHAAYVERQKRTYDAMDKEQQKSAARQIFDELTPKNAEIGMETEVLESKFREKLASSGFKDIDVIIRE